MEAAAAAWKMVRGGQQNKRPLELQQQEIGSKRINLGNNNYSRVVEASTSTSTVQRHKKRALELNQEDSDDYEIRGLKEAAFVAGADGAYSELEMPKRLNRGYNVGETSARRRAWDAEDERDTALLLRLSSEIKAFIKKYRD